MDKYTRWVIIILSLQLTGASIEIARLMYKLGYEEGKASVYQSFAEDGNEGTCYAPDGCGTTHPQRKHK